MTLLLLMVIVFMLDWGLKLSGYCGRCQHYFVYPEWRRYSTKYTDPDSNWGRECIHCFKASEQCIDEMWKEYWGSVL